MELFKIATQIIVMGSFTAFILGAFMAFGSFVIGKDEGSKIIWLISKAFCALGVGTLLLFGGVHFLFTQPWNITKELITIGRMAGYPLIIIACVCLIMAIEFVRSAIKTID